MNWDDVRLALAIARCRSLNSAAVALEVNQSTVGRRLAALEASLGVTLFKRSKQGVLLTDLGEIFVAKAAEMEKQAESLSEALQSTKNEAAGVLRVIGNQWMINQLVRSGLAEFMNRNPLLELRTIAGRPDTSLWRGEPGVALWFDTRPLDGSFQITLGKVPYAEFKKKGYDQGDRVAFFDEANPRTLANTQSLKGAGAAKMRLSALDADTRHEAIAAGIGQGYLPMCIAETDQRLERVSPNDALFDRTLYCHLHPDTIGSVRVQTFMTWLRAEFSQAFGGPSILNGK